MARLVERIRLLIREPNAEWDFVVSSRRTSDE